MNILGIPGQNIAISSFSLECMHSKSKLVKFYGNRFITLAKLSILVNMFP